MFGSAVRRSAANLAGWLRLIETRVVSPILAAVTSPLLDDAVFTSAFRRVMMLGAARMVCVASKMAKAWASDHRRSAWDMSGCRPTSRTDGCRLKRLG